MKDDVAISIKNISKSFKVPHEKHDTLKAKAVHIFSSRKFSKFVSLEDISFDIKKGEFFGIVGKNGCGKSTLLKIIANIYQPTKGKIKVNGNIAPFIELGVGFNPELTGRENVFLSGTILGLSRKRIEQLYDEIVDFAELKEFMDQKLKNYSSGMQVRLAFSIAVRAESEILLIDEVLAVGDAAFQAKCYDYFYKLKESNKTIVLVTHDMEAVKKFCNRAAYIKNGQISKLGQTSEVADRYSIDNFSSLENGDKDIKRSDKDVYIKNYKINSQIVKEGLPIGIDIVVAAKKPRAIVAALSIVKEDGIYVAGFNSLKDLPKFELKKGDNIFHCELAADQLTKSRYSIDVALFEPQNLGLMDSLSNRVQFNVINTAGSKDGIFNITGKWEANKA